MVQELAGILLGAGTSEPEAAQSTFQVMTLGFQIDLRVNAE